MFGPEDVPNMGQDDVDKFVDALEEKEGITGGMSEGFGSDNEDEEDQEGLGDDMREAA